MSAHLSFVIAHALYPQRGLTSAIAAGSALGLGVYPVCTALAAVSHGRATDITEVPSDAVRAQLEHYAAAVPTQGVLVGALGGHDAVGSAFDFAASAKAPFVLDLEISGPYGVTLLDARGIDALADRLDEPDIVIASATDAELMSGGAIESIDDAQVAAQRIVRKHGVRAVVIKCGVLPARHFGKNGAHGEPFSSDLYFDGSEFALFEAPYLGGMRTDGASSAFSVAILKALADGKRPLEAVQDGKRYVSDVLRATQEVGSDAPMQYFAHAALHR